MFFFILTCNEKKNTKKINVMKNCMKECNKVSFIAYEKRVKKIFAKKNNKT